MKFLGKDFKEVDKGYFGVRRCTICGEELRDVNLVEVYATNHFCFVPIHKTLVQRILVCQHCKAYMEIDDKLWAYYATYYKERFNKKTTNDIITILTNLSKDMAQKGIKLDVEDETAQQSLDFIYKNLCEKYGVCENVEEIISVFYK